MRNRKKSTRVSDKDVRKNIVREIGEFVTLHDENGSYVVPFHPEVVEISTEENEGEKLLRETSETMNKGLVHQASIHAGKSRGQRNVIAYTGIQHLMTGGGRSKIGVTRSDKSKSKSAVKAEKNSRKKNAKIARKVRRPTGSKSRK